MKIFLRAGTCIVARVCNRIAWSDPQQLRATVRDMGPTGSKAVPRPASNDEGEILGRIARGPGAPRGPLRDGWEHMLATAVEGVAVEAIRFEQRPSRTSTMLASERF
ncbi:hypothetical protein ACWD6K_16760 [Streptomyces sp. NPDC002431]